MAELVVIHRRQDDEHWVLHLAVTEDRELQLSVPLSFWEGAYVGTTVTIPDHLLTTPPSTGAYLKLEF